MFSKVAKSGPKYASFIFRIAVFTEALMKWAKQVEESKACDSERAREPMADGPDGLNQKS